MNLFSTNIRRRLSSYLVSCKYKSIKAHLDCKLAP